MGSRRWAGVPVHELTSWTINNVKERDRREALALLDRIDADYGCPLDAFVEVLNGPEPKSAESYTRDGRISRKVKKAGFPKMTEGVVKRITSLIERYRPDLIAVRDGRWVIDCPGRRQQDRTVQKAAASREK